MNKKKENSSFEIKSDEILSVLDLEVDIPDELLEKTIQKKNLFLNKSAIKFDFSKYLQVAVVFAAAILIGIVMGKNATTNTFNKKRSKEKQALIELREKHHFTDNNSFGKL